MKFHPPRKPLSQMAISSQSRHLPGAAESESPKDYGGYTAAEWGKFALDLAPIGMVVTAFTGDCPGIPTLKAFMLTFGTITLLRAVLKFAFKLGRDGAAVVQPKLRCAVQFMGVLQLIVGLWGIFFTFPRWRYLLDDDGLCSFPLFLSGFVLSAIIAGVILALPVYAVYYALIGRHRPPAEEEVQAGETAGAGNAGSENNA